MHFTKCFQAQAEKEPRQSCDLGAHSFMVTKAASCEQFQAEAGEHLSMPVDFPLKIIHSRLTHLKSYQIYSLH